MRCRPRRRRSPPRCCPRAGGWVTVSPPRRCPPFRGQAGGQARRGRQGSESGRVSPGAERVTWKALRCLSSTWKAKWGARPGLGDAGRPASPHTPGPPAPVDRRPRGRRTDRAAGPEGRKAALPGMPGRSYGLAPRETRLWQPPRQLRVGPPRSLLEFELPARSNRPAPPRPFLQLRSAPAGGRAPRRPRPGLCSRGLGLSSPPFSPHPKHHEGFRIS